MNVPSHVANEISRCVRGSLHGIREESSYGHVVLLQRRDHEQAEAAGRRFQQRVHTVLQSTRDQFKTMQYITSGIFDPITERIRRSNRRTKNN